MLTVLPILLMHRRLVGSGTAANLQNAMDTDNAPWSLLLTTYTLLTLRVIPYGFSRTTRSSETLYVMGRLRSNETQVGCPWFHHVFFFGVWVNVMRKRNIWIVLKN